MKLKYLPPVEKRKADGVSTFHQCPTCGKHGKLEVNQRKALWFCHRCQLGGIVGKKGLTVERDGPSDSFAPTLKEFQPAPRDAYCWFYLQERGMTDELIKQLRPHWGPSVLRVYFPCYEWADDKPCYFTGRAIQDWEHLNRWWCPRTGTFEKSKGEVVWGLHRIREPVRRLTICEGVFDAVWHPKRVALLGKRMTYAQRELITRITTEEIILYLDGNAVKEAHETALFINEQWRGKISLVRLHNDLQPDDLRGNDDPLFAKRERLA